MSKKSKIDNSNTSNKKKTNKEKNTDENFKHLISFKEIFSGIVALGIIFAFLTVFMWNVGYNIWFDKLSVEERQEYLSGDDSKLFTGVIETFEVKSISKTTLNVKEKRGKGYVTMKVAGYIIEYEDKYGKKYKIDDFYINDAKSSQIFVGNEDLLTIDKNKLCTFRYLQLTEKTLRELGIEEEYKVNPSKDKDTHYR